ncbi:Zinc finger C2H2-type [Sesbania bispinosa]|nr:Zinc finger C2H2-type [Sesbania bispinosa]
MFPQLQGKLACLPLAIRQCPQRAPPKKKRNLPGMPDPDAEVIALSPKTLMATNRFVCEICNKGFQRDQNLQLHRRGHNLPWKLRQRSSNEVRKRVGLRSTSAENTARRSGNATSAPRNTQFNRIGKLTPRFAVPESTNAIVGLCFQEESARSQTQPASKASPESDSKVVTGDSSPPPPAAAPPLSPAASGSSPAKLPEISPKIIEEPAANTAMNGSCSSSSTSTGSTSNNNGSTSSSVFASLFASSTASGTLQSQTPAFPDLITAMAHPADLSGPPSSESISLCLATNHASSILETGGKERRQYAPPPQPAMSATALLQKAAQMGAAATNTSLLCSLGIVPSSGSSSPGQQDSLQWGQRPVEPESASVPAALGLGLSL